MKTETAQKEEYKEFRLRVVLAIVFLGPVFGLGAALPWIFSDLPQGLLFLLWVYLAVYLVEVVSGFLLLRTGLARWFISFISALMVTGGIFGVSVLFILPKVESIGVYCLILASWILLFPLMWWWGARIFCTKDGEIKDAVLRSKRIDLEAQTYSPYHFPDNLFEAGWARKTVALSTAVGGLAIGLSVYVSHLVNTRMPDSEYGYGAFWGYLLVLLSVACVSAPYHEWRWIRNWEKKTGRRIYVKEIIEYKRLQERKLAEQSKLRSSRN